ncbi:MAG: hypothetical protein Q8M19_27800 [Reyranella sp.]|nr:hypothetical protein [Reyranella sp.]
MVDPVPQSAHDRAAVVFSRSFRFVEWKFVIAAQGTSTPFGDRSATPYQATREIDRRKWIYVFRNNHERETYADVQEEIRVDSNGDLAAVPTDRIGRGDPAPLGKTMCLPRRRFGSPVVYRFFASRVRLATEQIKELKSRVTAFAPPVILDPGDNLSVIEHDGALLVPVVDPVTVALHLHAAFTAAADDIINYTAAHSENTNRKLVERRRKKHLLATLLKSIIGEADNTGANNLVHALRGEQWPLEDFLSHYAAQVQWRVERRDRLGGFLTRWLQSDAIRIAAAAYRSASKESWPQFLAPWCQSITRLGESPPGRRYLDSLLDDRTHFIHTYVWPQKGLPEDGVQAVRKGGMTIFEAWKTLAERKILVKAGAVDELVASLRILLVPTGKQVLKPIDQVVEYGNLLRTTRTIKAVGIVAPEAIKPARPFATAPRAFGAIVESVNLVLAIKSTMDATSGDPKTRDLAIIGLVGSSLDAASAIGTLMKKSEKVVATISFVSGIIDVYLGHLEMQNAFKGGDTDAANAAFVTTAGSTIGVAGTFMALTAIPGGQIVAVIGLLIVAIGWIYKALAGKAPIERFFARCSWGKEHLVAGKPDWAPTDFKDWQGDKEFDRQLEALLSIICSIDISPGDSYRVLKYKMGWLPPYATLKVRYEEKWRDAADNRTLETEIQLSAQAPTSTAANAIARADGRNGVKVELVGKYLSPKDPHNGPYDMVRRRKLNANLKAIEVSGRLIVSFDGMANVTLPHKGWAKKQFH